MNNFYILNEALVFNTIDHFERGIFQLNEIIETSESHRDRFLKHPTILNYHTNVGFIVDLANNSTRGKLFWNLFKVFRDYDPYLYKETLFDSHFQDDCNGYLGFDFSATTIEERRRIIAVDQFKTFRDDCTETNVEKDFDSFWAERETYFPNLIFCENVYDNLNVFSVDDDRFLLIKEKLIRLDEYAGKWAEGAFPHFEMGINVSPDTKGRLKKSSSSRIYTCPDGSNKEFSWHVKLSAGTAYRIYYYPVASAKKIIIGVIGTKPELGF